MRALIADDDRATAIILARTLSRWGIEVATAHDGRIAWQLLAAGPAPAIAVIDWMMPGLDGLELCRRMRDDPALAATYVILLTGRSTRGDLIAGLDAGADDYMFKPIDTDELRARVQTGIRIATLQQRLTERVSELQTARDHLTRLASIDTLTDVYTRRWWFDMAGTELSRCVRYDHPLSVLLLDLDHFKRVNDTWGHHNGDNLLRAFADMLRAECRQSDIVGRLGGEEFAIVAAETPAAPAQALAARIGRACRRISVPTAHGSIACSCSIGLSELRPGDRTVDEILRRADGALYAAKRAGRDCWKCDADEPAEVVW